MTARLALGKLKQSARSRGCIFCQGTPLDWKAVDTLRQFTSERGKILSRAKTGTCAKHQRRLAQAIKRARIVALLPFKARV